MAKHKGQKNLTWPSPWYLRRPGRNQARWITGLIALLLLSLLALAMSAFERERKLRQRDQWLRAELLALQPSTALGSTCAHGDKHPLKILVLGQSNAGNHGQFRSLPAGADELQTLQGKECRQAQDPLPGGSGRGASIWSRLPQALRTEGLVRPPMVSLLAVQSTTIEDWTRPTSPLSQALDQRIQELTANDWLPDLVLWQQGEADAKAGTSRQNYERDFAHLVERLRKAKIQAPILVALSTHCESNGPASPHQREQQLAIRQALQNLPHRFSEVFAGPDTDTLTGEFRSDACHFSSSGLDAAATLWSSQIASVMSKKP